MDQRVQQSLNVTVFKYVNKACPYCIKEVFEYASQGRVSSRNNYAKLKVPFRKTTIGQKNLSYIGPSVSNKLPSSMKRNISLNKCFKTLFTRIKNLILLLLSLLLSYFFFYKNQLLQKMKLKQKTYSSALTIILCVLTGKTKNGKYKL